MTQHVPAGQIKVLDIPTLSDRAKTKLISAGYVTLQDFHDKQFPTLYSLVSFEQAKELLKILLEKNISVHFSKADWSEDQWREFVGKMVSENIVSWSEVALAVCGELNPPQVGTAIASNKSFQSRFPARETMRNVMSWFYEQRGKCVLCGTRMFLEADHIRSKQEFWEAGEDPLNADTLDNLQLLCKRCNVIKRPSHALGGISFAPAQSVLIWILLARRPKTKAEFATLCREHGLTMASIRFDEAWAFAVWLHREGKYEMDISSTSQAPLQDLLND
ncbi:MULTISPECIES: HNH endonuclease [Burkholderia]|uniref:HNH endonuclease n=1 Tax=Burkholderia TaxID=32008 RepID=UPI0009EB61FC|nr:MULTISPECIES: HNH endonuclease signature motif containing protein [Burkholderia]